tara:strand:- start:12271 stop:12585 length:315 start_codon:yes stop_codon:yes gene_type:complete
MSEVKEEVKKHPEMEIPVYHKCLHKDDDKVFKYLYHPTLIPDVRGCWRCKECIKLRRERIKSATWKDVKENMTSDIDADGCRYYNWNGVKRKLHPSWVKVVQAS